MKELPIGVHVFAGDTPGLAAGIVAADGAGLDVAWVTLGPNAPDPFVVYTQAAAQAQRIQFGTSIVTTFPRHPLAMAQSAMALDQVAPGGCGWAWVRATSRSSRAFTGSRSSARSRICGSTSRSSTPS